MMNREVVAALITRRGRVLVCQRPPEKARGLLWEFVGGKVEPGETHAQALLRECAEELGVRVTVGKRFYRTTHEYPDISIDLSLYYADITSGEPVLLEHADARWVLPREMADMPFCPADEEIINTMIEGAERMKEVLEFLKAAGTYYLATVDSGEPRVRPFGTIDDFDGGLYIQTGKIKPVYRQLKENPHFEICAFHEGNWIRLSGEAEEDDRLEAREHMLDAYPELRRMYKADDGNTVVFRLTKCTAVISSFFNPPKTITFI